MDTANSVETEVYINAESDIVKVRKVTRDVTKKMGFGITDITRIVTAASELARNIYLYAKNGVMTLNNITLNGKTGIELVFQDNGPGIEDVDLAMGEGYSSSKSLGLGLPGTKRLMDDMSIESISGMGTKIIIRKWKR